MKLARVAELIVLVGLASGKKSDDVVAASSVEEVAVNLAPKHHRHLKIKSKREAPEEVPERTSEAATVKPSGRGAVKLVEVAPESEAAAASAEGVGAEAAAGAVNATLSEGPALPEGLPRLSLPGISWADDAMSLWTTTKCMGKTSCEDCRDSGCHMCQGGSIMRAIFKYDYVIPSTIRNLFNEEERETGNLCGFAAEPCQEIVDYYNRLPSVLQKLIEWFGVIEIPVYDPCGEPNGVAQTLQAGFGTAAFLVTAALIF